METYERLPLLTSNHLTIGSMDPITDLDDAIEYASKNNSYYFQTVAFFGVGIMFMTDAMEMTLLSFLYPCMKHYWKLGDTSADSLISAVYFGQLFGSLLAGPLADMWGRKPISLLGMTIVAVAGMLSSFSPDVWCFVILRSITGVGIGTNAVPYDLLSEITPLKYRGRILVALNFWWCCGSVFTVLLAWHLLSQENGWRTLVFSCSLPVFVSACVMVWLPESPRWLLSEGRVCEAEEVIRTIARTNGMIIPTLALKKQRDEDVSVESQSVREFTVLFRGQERRRRTFAILIVWLLMGFTFSSVSLLVTRISSSNDDSCQGFDFPFLSSIYSVQFIGALSVLFLIDWIGRINSSVCFFSVACIGTILLGLSGETLTTKYTWLMELSGIIALAAGMGASASIWVMTPEQYETSIRSTGHTAATAMARIGALCSSYWVDSIIPEFWIAAFLGACCMLAAVAVSTLGDKTSSKLL
jgi:MFS transporter, putative metabolite:H+ symporter